MKRILVHCAVLMILMWSLLSCLPGRWQQPVVCAEVGDSRLEDFPFKQPKVPTARAWIQERFALDASQIRYRDSTVGIEYLDWQALDRDYGASFWNRDGPTASAGFAWQKRAPTVGDAVRCLGAPEAYRAYHKPNPDAGPWTYLELWYPQRGLKLLAFLKREVSALDENMSLAGAEYAQPGSTAELTSRFWVVAPGLEAYNQIVAGLKAWPGSVKDLVIDDPR